MKSATDLFEELRAWRNGVADEMHREPYMVLQNSVLLEIATKQPDSLAALRKMKGFGDTKLSQFGRDILAIVKGESEGLATYSVAQDPLEENVYTVAGLIDSINRLLSFQNVVVRGEIGSVDKRGRYTFFTLLDPTQDALINCFVWEEKLLSQGVELTEGMTIQISGHPSIYKRTGRLTFEVERVSLLGEGELKVAFARLKERLAKQGFFNLERKRPLPQYVRRIGLVTSSYADAKKDFLTHLGSFGFAIDFYHIRVEGLYAVDDIKKALAWFNKQPAGVEVIVLTRGGGSLDSMQAFNNEEVASAIFASRIPVLTGIGHENDLSIADLVADRFASTPTDAGRILSEDWRRLSELLAGYERYFASHIAGIFTVTKEQLSRFEERFIQKIETLLALHRTRLRDTRQNLFSGTGRLLTQTAETLLASEKLLRANDPLHRLKQGYSIIRNQKGDVVKSSRTLAIGETLQLVFAQGQAASKIEKLDHDKTYEK